MTYAETGVLASAVVATNLVRAYVSADGHGKQFGDGTTSASCPEVASVVQISQETQNVLPASGNTSTVNGAVRLFLTPASGDTTTAGSQQAPWLEPTATVVLATG
jgi:hypothetical protein